jgi:hypothetical protein
MDFIGTLGTAYNLHAHASTDTDEDLVANPLARGGGWSKCSEEAVADGTDDGAEDSEREVVADFADYGPE